MLRIGLYELHSVRSTLLRMILLAATSSFGRMPVRSGPRDNGGMSTATVDRVTSGDRNADSIRASWDRLRAWDDDHRFWSDAGIAVAVLIGCIAFPHRFAVGRPESFLFQLALIVPLVWRRKAPSTVFAIIASVALVQWSVTVPLPADAALLVALFTLAVHDTPRRALIGAGVLEVGVIMASVRWSPAGDNPKSVIFLSGLVAAALFIGMTLRTWRAYMDSLLERADRLEFERDQQAQLAAAAERSRIAREMHDVVAHNVSIMVTLADGAGAVASSNPVQAKEAMAEVSAAGRLALTDMRHLLGVLRTDGLPADRAPQPQLEGIPKLVDGVRCTGLDVELSEQGSTFDMPPGVALTIYRIIQESLTNILKHADRPSTAQIVIAFASPYVDLSIRDDGRPAKHGIDGHGIGGMRERAAMCEGQLEAGPRPEGGWEVKTRIRAGR